MDSSSNQNAPQPSSMPPISPSAPNFFPPPTKTSLEKHHAKTIMWVAVLIFSILATTGISYAVFSNDKATQTKEILTPTPIPIPTPIPKENISIDLPLPKNNKAITVFGVSFRVVGTIKEVTQTGDNFSITLNESNLNIPPLVSTERTEILKTKTLGSEDGEPGTIKDLRQNSQVTVTVTYRPAIKQWGILQIQVLE